MLPADRDGGGRKKDEGDEKGEAKGRRPASRTKTQVHIQGDVGRCPRVTSIKDGLTPFADDGLGRHIHAAHLPPTSHDTQTPIKSSCKNRFDRFFN